MVLKMRLWRAVARYLSGSPASSRAFFRAASASCTSLRAASFCPLRPRVLQLVHGLGDGPLQREGRGRDGQGLLVVERGVSLNVGRRDEVEELPMGHRAERRGPLSPVRTEDVVDGGSPAEHLDAKHGADVLGPDGRRTREGLLDPAEAHGQGVGIDGHCFRLLARSGWRVLFLLGRRCRAYSRAPAPSPLPRFSKTPSESLVRTSRQSPWPAADVASVRRRDRPVRN